MSVGLPNSGNCVLLPLIHFHLTWSLVLSVLSLMVIAALPCWEGKRHPFAGAAVQPGTHTPATGGLPLGQLVHSAALGPEQVVQDVSQPEQPVSLVAVQAALSNCPAGQVGLHVSHVV